MVYLSRIYTKSGDAGETGLGDGTRAWKDSPRVTAIGEVDELNAIVGLAVAQGGHGSALLRGIQNDLFDLGADLCVPLKADETDSQSLRILPIQSERLEREIDKLNERLQPLASFVLPGGSAASAWLHLARTVCRRASDPWSNSCAASRSTQMSSSTLNRLSDLLFVLARVANDDGKGDILWVPGQSRSS